MRAEGWTDGKTRRSKGFVESKLCRSGGFTRGYVRGKTRGGYRVMKLKKKKRGGKLRCLYLAGKRFCFIYDAITWEK